MHTFIWLSHGCGLLSSSSSPVPSSTLPSSVGINFNKLPIWLALTEARRQLLYLFLCLCVLWLCVCIISNRCHLYIHSIPTEIFNLLIGIGRKFVWIKYKELCDLCHCFLAHPTPSHPAPGSGNSKWRCVYVCECVCRAWGASLKLSQWTVGSAVLLLPPTCTEHFPDIIIFSIRGRN